MDSVARYESLLIDLQTSERQTFDSELFIMVAYTQSCFEGFFKQIWVDRPLHEPRIPSNTFETTIHGHSEARFFGKHGYSDKRTFSFSDFWCPHDKFAVISAVSDFAGFAVISEYELLKFLCHDRPRHDQLARWIDFFSR